MALAPIRVVVLGTVAFLVFWTLAVFPSFKLLPIGRTAGAVAGAVLTVVFQVDSPSEAYGSVDLSVLGLLFGTMVVGVYLERADMFRYLGDVLSWKSKGGWDLLTRVCVMSALASALFTNDTCCLVLTEFVLKLCRQKNLPPKPFLLALASSANIGSSATPIGNPQNLVIAVQSGVSFGKFLLGLYKSMLLGVIVNTALLLLMYRKQLSPVKDLERGGSSHSDNIGTKDQMTASPWTPFHSGNVETSTEIFHDSCSEVVNESNQSPPRLDAIQNSVFEKAPSDGKMGDVILPFDSTTGAYQVNEVDMSHLEGEGGDLKASLQGHQNSLPVNSSLREHRSPLNHNEIQTQRSNPEQMSPSRMESSLSLDNINLWKRRLWKCAVYFVTIAMLAALLYGLDLSWTALTAAVTLMALDFCDAGPSLEKVSYLLLVFFAGMFITVDGFNTTGIPGTFWDAVEPNARINSVVGVIILSLVVIVLSNLASNVPTVLLLGSRVSQSAASTGASVTRAWLILAWASTVAGNLTLVGSAANLIVSEQARKAQFLGYELTFGSHIIFGFPSTLIVTAVGLPFIRG